MGMYWDEIEQDSVLLFLQAAHLQMCGFAVSAGEFFPVGVSTYKLKSMVTWQCAEWHQHGDA